jgi:hypothetical protein
MFNDPIIADWSQVDLKTPEGNKLFVEAIDDYLGYPDRAMRGRMAKVQEMTGKGDFPDISKLFVTPPFFQEDPFDEAWRLLFDLAGRDPDTLNKEGFKIKDVGNGLTFAKVLEGEKCKVFKFTGAEATVTYDLYGGAIEWSRKWADDEDWMSIQEAIRQARNAYNRDRSQAFYDLISASRADSDIAWAGSSGQTAAIRDADTINAAVSAIIAACDSLGLNVNSNSSFVLIAPIQLKSRIMSALRNLQSWTVSGAGGTAASGQGSGQVEYNLTPAFTTMLKNQALSAADTTHYMIGLPGRQIKGGIRKPLELDTENNLLAYATTLAGWGRFGGAIGETNQLRRCSTS